jgi:hypothetical protein
MEVELKNLTVHWMCQIKYPSTIEGEGGVVQILFETDQICQGCGTTQEVKKQP